MDAAPPINLVSMAHLILLCLWGGVVSAESVMELYPFRRRDYHEHSIRLHYWIDLLVELPLILGVLGSGAVLVALAWPLSGIHFVKVLCALVTVSANLVCVVLVVKRRRLLGSGGGDDELWRVTRRIVACAVVGMPFAAAAAGMGFWLAYHRLLELLSA